MAADTSSSSAERIAAAVELLQGHPDFRVLRRLGSGADVVVRIDGTPARAAIVDVETTGRGAEDRIVEFALVVFEYEPSSGVIGSVLGAYDGLEDPGMPIPAEVTAIHGITDEMVAGHALDEAAIGALLDGVTLVIAHNAAFDRPFVERRLSSFAGVAWGCSYTQIPWAEEGFSGAKLEYLAMRSGFFYEAHRGEADCRALLELLRQPLPRSGAPALRSLLANAAEPSYCVWALDSPFEKRETLKARGYKWNAERRCWHRTMARDALREEAAWLKAEVYGGRAREVEIEKLDALSRFSGRAGPRAVRAV